ncbi:hypothetical protein ACT17R_16645 [Sphingopyxis sp. Q841]
MAERPQSVASCHGRHIGFERPLLQARRLKAATPKPARVGVFSDSRGDPSDATHLAHRFALAGGDVTLRVWPEMVHAWPLFQHGIPVAGNAAIAEAGKWISARVGAMQPT